VDQDGKIKTPVMLHRAILGSYERFVMALLERFAGALPTWLSPVQVAVLPIADRHLDYARKCNLTCAIAGVRSELDERQETLGAKIRDWQQQKVPYMLIVGDKEIQENKIAVRRRDGTDLGSLPLDEFIKNLRIEIQNKSVT
jgi:threonyl-tRNA synthetase